MWRWSPWSCSQVKSSDNSFELYFKPCLFNAWLQQVLFCPWWMPWKGKVDVFIWTLISTTWRAHHLGHFTVAIRYYPVLTSWTFWVCPSYIWTLPNSSVNIGSLPPGAGGTVELQGKLFIFWCSPRWSELSFGYLQKCSVLFPSSMFAPGKQNLFPLSLSWRACAIASVPKDLLKIPALNAPLLICVFLPPNRSVQTFADKSKQEALKNDLVEALKRKQQS